MTTALRDLLNLVYYYTMTLIFNFEGQGKIFVLMVDICFCMSVLMPYDQYLRELSKCIVTLPFDLEDQKHSLYPLTKPYSHFYAFYLLL